MHRFLRRALLPGMLAAIACPAFAELHPSQTVLVPARTPLRVVLDCRVPVSKPGVEVSGHLASPVYIRDRLVLPSGTPVEGTVIAVTPDRRSEHVQWLMRGDFTPPRQARIEFHRLVPSGEPPLTIATDPARPAGDLVRVTVPDPATHSLWGRLRTAAKQKAAAVRSTLTAPHKWRRLKDAVWLSLPYHPQWIAPGSAFEADLSQPLPVLLPPAPAAAALSGPLPGEVRVHARLVTPLTSATDKAGMPLEAILTDPVFDSHHRLLLPEGAELSGHVVRARPAKWFGRNGRLRFTFQSVTLPAGERHRAHGQMAAATGAKEMNLRVDTEGGAEAQPAPNRFLAPLVLAVLAVGAQQDDEGGGLQGFLGGAFGLTGRIAALAARRNAVSATLVYYSLAQSLWKRWIAPGKNVVFPRDTRMIVDLGPR